MPLNTPKKHASIVALNDALNDALNAIRAVIHAAIITLGVLLPMLFTATASSATTAPTVKVVAQLKQRPANPAVDSQNNLYFTMHPLGGSKYKLQKLVDGTAMPFPNEAWATPPTEGKPGISNAIGIHITRDDTLWVLDMGSAQHTAKLIAWNIKSNSLKQITYIPKEVTVNNSFLQDFAIDTKRNMAYIADMSRSNLTDESNPAIIAINLKTGMAKRLLASHSALQPQGEDTLEVSGKPLYIHHKGQKHNIHLGLNPIAIDSRNKWVYFSTVNKGHVYRIKSKHLANHELSANKLKKYVQKYGPKPDSDGIAVGKRGKVYVTDLTQNAIGVTTRNEYNVLVKDKALTWPDGIFVAKDGSLYITVSQLHTLPPFNKEGEDTSKPPYPILRLSL